MGKSMKPKAVEAVEQFWSLMMTNNFRSVGSVLSDEFILEWPQSNERIRGRDNFVRMNEEYPAHGPWSFMINRVVGNDSEAVSDVSITDGVEHARAISFFSVDDGLIVKLIEYWPEPTRAHENRAHLVERFEDQ
jgi:hypothetical protein